LVAVERAPRTPEFGSARPDHHGGRFRRAVNGLR
jgi:hypothetical protein